MALDERFQTFQEVCGRFKGGPSVGEDNAVSNNAIFGDHVGQHQRRFGDDATGGMVRVLHWQAHWSHAELANLGSVSR